MTPPLSRRRVLKGGVALGATSSIGALTARRARAQGSSAKARTQIDSVLRQATDAKEVPGVVAMAATDQGLLYEGAFGARSLDQSAAMTLDTVFRIASMTKAITSVAAMQLVEQGKLKIEEPVPNNTYYWLDPSKRVTGLIMTQILPFADPRAVKLYGQFEKGVYEAVKTA